MMRPHVNIMDLGELAVWHLRFVLLQPLDVARDPRFICVLLTQPQLCKASCSAGACLALIAGSAQKQLLNTPWV
jgi:hypothetical protein